MTVDDAVRIVLVGLGATVVLDLWMTLLKTFGIKGLDLAYVGRWIGHLMHGRSVRPSIGKAAPIRGEVALGWVSHYAVGVGFAALLFAACGSAWFHDPSPFAALVLGACTVVAPLFIMQPAMGAGIAASKTPTPWTNRIRSLVNHIVFGLGLYLTAILIDAFN